MVILNSPLAAGSSLSPAVVGLVGALIGGVVTGSVSLLVAWQARKSAERAWVRDNRREIYEQFLMCAQGLLIACEAYHKAPRKEGKATAKVESAFTSFWEVYSVVQTVADTQLFKAARIHGYQLWELAASLGSTSVMGPENFGEVAKCVRKARHATIAEMRAELGLGDVRPDSAFNPFAGTDLKDKYTPGERPGPLTLGDGRESIP